MKIQKKGKGVKIQAVAVNKNFSKTESKPSKNKLIIWLALITFAIIVTFSPSLKNGITNWDDDQYVEKNPWFKELTGDNLKSMFSSYYMGNYHPLAILSLSIDFHIGGKNKKGEMEPTIYHFTNLIIHIINSLLVFWLIFMLFSRFEIATISAFLFGLSTLHVESVAWISERKDVLYAMFFIASLIAYVLYVKHGKLKYYIYAFLLFTLSLFSKGQAVSLAVTLFAIDYLFDRKLLEKKAILDKIPFLLMALIFGLIAIKAQKAGNAMSDVDSYEFYKRIGFAGFGFTQYLVKLLVPVGLSAIYPYPDILNKSIPAIYWLFMIPVLIVSMSFFYFLKRSKVVTFCIAFFIINIFLLLQLIPVGSAIWADRYSYIPSIAYYALLGWLIYLLLEKYASRKYLIYGIAGVYLVTIGILSYNRCKIWETSLSLWDDTIEKSPKAVVAWNNRGSIKDKANRHAEAIDDFTKAIEYKPDYTHAFYNRGTAKKNLAEKVRDSSIVESEVILKSAIEDFDYALKLNHAFVEALQNRGLAKETLSDYARTIDEKNLLLQSALEDIDKTINLNPEYKNAFQNRGVIKGKLNRFDEAIEDFNQAIAFAPDSASGYTNRGLAKLYKKDYQGALSDFNKAIELKPDFETAYLNRGLAYREQKKYSAALIDFSKVIELKPNLDVGYLNRGITYRESKTYSSSIKDFTYAIRLNPNLAAAYYFRGLDMIVLNKKDEGCSDLQKARNLGHFYAQEQMNRYCNK